MDKLMWLFAIPWIALAFVLLFPISSSRSIKRIACALSLLPLLFLAGFDVDSWLGEQVRYAWIPTLGIEFYLKVDSLSLLFLYLTALIIPIAAAAVKSSTLDAPRSFYALILLLQGLLIGFFTAQDLVLFTIFWEAMLFPLYFLISFWGKEGRRAAALRFLVYMIAGSSLMIAAVLALYVASAAQGVGSFSIEALADAAAASPYAPWVFGVLVLAFSVKTPLFPFHGWLPDVYAQASTAGTILLSGLLSKAGIYGFFRIGLGLFPELLKEWGPVLLPLAIVGVLYGGLAAWVQNDYKRLLAYSSFSHVNFILAGLFVWSETAHEGAALQAINHGITITGLFLVAGWLEARLETSSMRPFGGIAKMFPLLCWLTMIFVLSSVALPGTNNFIGELLILFGLFGQHPWQTLLLGLSVILSVMYMLRWMQYLYFNAPRGAPSLHVRDIQSKELLIALPLVLLIFWIGLYPEPIFQLTHKIIQSTTVINREGGE